MSDEDSRKKLWNDVSHIDSHWNDPDLVLEQKGFQYQQILLQQYSEVLKTAEATSERRLKTNAFFLTINTAIIGAVAYSLSQNINLKTAVFSIVGSLAGVAISMVWFTLLSYMRGVNTAKFEMLGHMESQMLCNAMSDGEWSRLQGSEKWTPWKVIKYGISCTFPFLHWPRWDGRKPEQASSGETAPAEITPVQSESPQSGAESTPENRSEPETKSYAAGADETLWYGSLAGQEQRIPIIISVVYGLLSVAAIVFCVKPDLVPHESVDVVLSSDPSQPLQLGVNSKPVEVDVHHTEANLPPFEVTLNPGTAALELKHESKQTLDISAAAIEKALADLVADGLPVSIEIGKPVVVKTEDGAALRVDLVLPKGVDVGQGAEPEPADETATRPE